MLAPDAPASIVSSARITTRAAGRLKRRCRRPEVPLRSPDVRRVIVDLHARVDLRTRSGPFIGSPGAGLDSSVEAQPSLEGGIHRAVPRSGQECGVCGSYVPVWPTGLSTAAHGDARGGRSFVDAARPKSSWRCSSERAVGTARRISLECTLG